MGLGIGEGIGGGDFIAPLSMKISNVLRKY